MKNKYTIKNFRVFDQEGATIDIAPITILTGCNSSGKSSIVKSLLLLCDYFSALKEDKANGKDMDLNAHRLDFSKRPHNSLGKFSKVVNRKSDKNYVTMEIVVPSLMLAQDVALELTFAASDADGQTHGYLSSFSMKKMDGTVFYSSSNEESSSINLYCLFDDFVKFTDTVNIVDDYNSLVDLCNIGENPFTGSTFDVTEEDVKSAGEELDSYMDAFEEKYSRKELFDINRWNHLHKSAKSFIPKEEDELALYDKMKETGLVYYLPILEEKLNGTKEESLEFLADCIELYANDKAMLFVLNSIIEDFRASETDSFMSYYKSYESAHLAQLEVHQGAKPFSAKKMSMTAGDIALNPYHIAYGSFLPLDGDELVKAEEERENDHQRKIAEWESKRLSFSRLFEALTTISSRLSIQGSGAYNNEYFGHTSSKTEPLFFDFIEVCLEEILTEAVPDALMYVSSSIINVKRLYPLESADEFTALLKRYLNACRTLELPQHPIDLNRISQQKRKVVNKYVPGTFMNKWIKEFGIGESISIDVDPEGLGVTLRLHSDETDTTGSLLADSGYGITQIFAILLNIEVAIMERDMERIPKDNVVYDRYLSEDDTELKISAATLAIEEPEIHLHPNFQSHLTDMFVEAYKDYGIQFILETHSEYLIRKLQTYIPLSKSNPEKGLSKEEVSICYLYDANVSERPMGEPQVKRIGFRDDGSLDSPFGKGFFDEADNLAMSLLFNK